MTPEQKDWETRILAHRYLYYVLCTPVLPDHHYDSLERKAWEILEGVDSPVHSVGSSLDSSYSEEVKDFAINKILNPHPEYRNKRKE